MVMMTWRGLGVGGCMRVMVWVIVLTVWIKVGWGLLDGCEGVSDEG